jgi:protease-4
MKFSPVIADVIRSVWAMAPAHISAWAPMVNNWLKGTHEFADPTHQVLFFTILSGAKMEQTSGTGSFKDVPENSIAIIPLEGPMTLKGGLCSFGTEEIAALVKEAGVSKNISALILNIDSGGGTTDSIVPLVEAINFAKSNNKPVVAFCNTALSAAYRVASECSAIVASNDMAEFGSIGVFVKFPDEEGYLASQGLRTIKVYAPESADKNQPLEQALQGNFDLIQSEILTPHAINFQENVKKARGEKLKLDTPGILSGRVFFAKAVGFDSIENGLIDSIGNLDFAIAEAKRLSSSNVNNKNFTNKSPFNMNKTQIPVLLSVLGFEALELVEGRASLTKSDVDKIQQYSVANFGKPVLFRNTSIDNDGFMSISAEGLFSVNAQLVDFIVQRNSEAMKQNQNHIAEMEERHRQEVEALNSKISKLADLPEETAAPKRKVAFATPQVGINAVDDQHIWNKAALAIAGGDRKFAHVLIENGHTKESMSMLQEELKVHGASTLDISQMNTVLGARYIENVQAITDMLVANEEIANIFPWRSTGIKDELPGLTLYAQEFLQARNAQWSEKGGFELQADIIKVKNWQVSHRFTSAQMWAFIESWLATKTTGTDPFQESLVSWLTNKMMTQIMMVERPVNAIKGVYVTPVSGVAGRSINSMDGLFINIINLIKDNRILPFRVGRGNYDMLDGNGNPNKNHVYYKCQDLIARMPQNLRDAFKWNVYISKNDERERQKFLKEVVATNSNFVGVEKAESYDNFNVVPVPHWVDGLIVITVPGNILQGYREKADDNRLTYDREKRDTIVFMDGGYVIAPVLSGYKYDTLADLVASNGQNQRIFTNAEFGPFTPLDLAAGDVTPSVAVHNVLRTSANAGATVITKFDDANVGDVIYLIGGSNTNSSVIDKDNTDFIGIGAADLTMSEGTVAKFMCTATGKFTMLAVYQESSVGAIEFAADDVTPSVAMGQLFITNPANSAATAITNFDDAIVGVPFKVLGGGGTYASTIAKSGKFAYISGAFTADAGEEIVLVKRPDGTFVETLI